MLFGHFCCVGPIFHTREVQRRSSSAHLTGTVMLHLLQPLFHPSVLSLAVLDPLVDSFEGYTLLSWSYASLHTQKRKKKRIKDNLVLKEQMDLFKGLLISFKKCSE